MDVDFDASSVAPAEVEPSKTVTFATSVAEVAPTAPTAITEAQMKDAKMKRKSFSLLGEEEESDDEFYDDDEDDEELYGKVGSGDEDFYDEDKDEKDAKWMRNKHLERNGLKVPKDETEPVPNLKFKTDAILSCPCCFNMVCMDCQKHVKYNQYRAMFVQNCRIDFETTLQPKSGTDVLHPVLCTTCKAEIGVYDQDEVYHFFDVIPSQS